jgi:Stage II sporulation protein
MKDKQPFNFIFQNFGAWAVPLISVTAFFPIVLTYLADSKTATNEQPPQQQSVLPPLSQLPPPTQQSKKPLITPDPVISRPQPIATPQAAQEAPSVKSQEKAKPTPPKKQPVAAKPAKVAPLPPAPSYTPPKLEVRVAIARDEPQSVIGVSQSAAIADRNGQILKNLSPNQGLVVTPNGSNLTIGSSTLPSVVFVQPSSGGLIYVGDRWYRGKILIVSQGSSLLVVNYVNLEEYLYSVVGSEMHPNAPIESLKAQAIAARSYALVHLIRPASPWYNLGNTQRWQVYKGLQTEYNTTHRAVNETAGQILSYKGGVVESLYAATDEIVARAHGGRGMSQTGAYEFANKGYDYQEILGHYYPGVGLARLVLQN